MKICPSCYAVCIDQKWDFDEAVRAKAMKGNGWEKHLCPGCERVAKGQVDGVVYLRGDFIDKHREEAKNLIRSVAQKKLRKNIAARIYHIEEKKEEIMIETTDRVLAERLGKEFEKAFSGHLDIQWQHHSDFARVYWTRD
ncbi:MAG: BCAM0308 family protein [Actinomycetota bacterium]|nr:BCAM0308 family protein [Actinomycetota bacterium]MDD5667952.1 BCAM0308 family protein [Actinomycetota bacterium]